MSRTAKRNYGFKRVFGKIVQHIARFTPLIPGKIRVKLQKYRGVNFKNPSSSFLGYDVYFDDIYPELVFVGERVRITSGTKILTHYLDTTKPPFNFLQGKVIIGNNVFIGMNVIIIKPVVIGDNAVIAAGSIVTKNVPENAIVGGVPAKILGQRSS